MTTRVGLSIYHLRWSTVYRKQYICSVSPKSLCKMSNFTVLLTLSFFTVRLSIGKTSMHHREPWAWICLWDSIKASHKMIWELMMCFKTSCNDPSRTISACNLISNILTSWIQLSGGIQVAKFSGPDFLVRTKSLLAPLNVVYDWLKSRNMQGCTAHAEWLVYGCLESVMVWLIWILMANV